MADYVSTLRADTSQHDRALSDASKKVSDYKKETDKASASINGMKDATSRSTRELMKEMSTMENLGRSTSNYKRQLADITKQISDLTINYRNMSEEQKNGAFGQEVAAKIDELKNKAAEYRDAIGDVSAEIKNLASDTATWDSMKQGIDVVSSSLQAFVSLGVLGEQSTEKLVAVIAKLKAVETATNAVIKIGNALQKNSALLLGVTKVQALAAARAKTLEGNATAVATVKQKAFNVVAKANPYVLLASAVIAVVGALAAFAKGEDEVTLAEKRHQEQMEREKAKTDAWAQKVGDSVGGMIAKYKLLQIEWSRLETASQKTRWIKENQSAFEQLGLKVNTVTDAENVFVKNTDAVVEALKKRAMAAAKQSQLTELYSKLMEEQVRADAEYERLKKEYGQDYYEEISPRTQGNFGTRPIGQSHLNSRTGQRETGAYYYTERGVKNANKKIYAETHAGVTRLQGEIDALAADIAGSIDIGDIFTPSSNGGGSSVTEAAKGSIAYIKSQISEAQKLRDQAVVGSEAWWEQVHALEALNEQLEEAEAKQRRLTSNLEPLAPISNPITAQVQGPAMKLAGKNPYEKLQEQLADFEKFYEKTMENIAGYSDVFNSIGTICSNLGGILGEEGAAWMQFGAQVAQSVSKMLPQIASLVLANQAAAIAEGTASSAAVPFPGNLVAIASIVAELIAIFAALPKFAEGGIIGGSNTIGDYNLARVNSGEMILNGTQQAKLFNMINAGGLYDNGEGAGSVSFKIRGNDLVGVLNNYNQKLSKR